MVVLTGSTTGEPVLQLQGDPRAPLAVEVPQTIGSNRVAWNKSREIIQRRAASPNEQVRAAEVSNHWHIEPLRASSDWVALRSHKSRRKPRTRQNAKPDHGEQGAT